MGRRFWIIIVISIVVAVAGGVGIWIYYRSQPVEETAVSSGAEEIIEIVGYPDNLPVATDNTANESPPTETSTDEPAEPSSETSTEPPPATATETPPDSTDDTATDYNTPHFDAPGCRANASRGNVGKLDCDNGIWRVRGTSGGIMWFDFYHTREQKWYLNKNAIDFIATTADGVMGNSELDQVDIQTSLASQTEDSVQVNHLYVFKNNAKVRVEVTINKDDPLLHLRFYTEPDSAKITYFSWTVTNGMSEAVDTLAFDGKSFSASDYQMPLEGKSLELQHLEFFSDVKDLQFYFNGTEGAEKDPNNPWWMGRYLGLKQYIKAEKPLRKLFGDRVSFEVRDVPWQATWKIPEKRPWFEGIWLERRGKLLEGDGIDYGITNYPDYQ